MSRTALTRVQMTRRLVFPLAGLAATAFLAACSGAGEMSEPEQPAAEAPAEEGEDTSSESMTALSGIFAGADGKTVEGTVSIEDGTLTLEDFSSDEGPDLHLYLASGDDSAAVEAGTELDVVAYDEASQTFDVSGVDLSEYDHVIVHCDKARAVFGSAPLS